MDALQTLLESSTTPALTAFLLGLLTALSPCPLATNIAAIGYISKDVENRRTVFYKGVLYSLGRIAAYTLLGFVLVFLLRQGSSLFGIQQFIGKYGEMLIGPALLLTGLAMPFAHRLRMPTGGLGNADERIDKRSPWGAFWLGCLFALTFCPTSGVFYFGILIPLSASTAGGYALPALFAAATALPVLVVAWVLAFSFRRIGRVYGQMQSMQRWLGRIVACLFVLIGAYYCFTVYA